MARYRKRLRFDRFEFETADRLKIGLVVLVILIALLAVVSFSLIYSIISVDSNIFSTGQVSINLNDGKPIIEEEGYDFSPGAESYEKEFFIKNNSSCDVYYRIYFDNVEGGLADVLEVVIYNGEQVLYEGTAATLVRDKVLAADDELKIGEKRTLRITFSFPDHAGNVEGEPIVKFDLCVDAVQTKNNPDRLFD